MAEPSTLNDPFDGQREVDTSLTYDEYRAIWRPWTRMAYGGYPRGTAPESTYQKVFDEFVKDFNLERGINNVGICSLSEVVDNQLLWAHYAEGHTGFAVEFDTTGPISDKTLTLRQVTYTSHYTKPRLVDLYQGGYDAAFDAASEKGAEWSYEREWRLLSHYASKAAIAPWPIVGVVVGHRMAASRKDILKRVVGDLVPIKEARPVPGSYQMLVT